MPSSSFSFSFFYTFYYNNNKKEVINYKGKFLGPELKYGIDDIGDLSLKLSWGNCAIL